MILNLHFLIYFESQDLNTTQVVKVGAIICFLPLSSKKEDF